MNWPLHTEVRKATQKAEDAIRQAIFNLQADFPVVTANRAYYTAYYCIVALLYTKSV